MDEYDSAARWYYPAIMRTTTIDPLAEKYYSISPYAWCGNNPVMRIDPDGMDWVITTEQKDGKTIYHITVNAVLYNGSSMKYTNKQMNQLADKIKNECNSVFNTSGEDYSVDFKMKLNVVNSVEDIKSTDHVYKIVDQKEVGGNIADTDQNSSTLKVNSLEMRLGTNFVGSILGLNNLTGYDVRSLAHELGHSGGLGEANKNPEGVTDIAHNIMAQSFYVIDKKIPLNSANQITGAQIKIIYNNLQNGNVNNYAPSFVNTYKVLRIASQIRGLSSHIQ